MKVPWIIIYAIIVHMVNALCLLINGTSQNITALVLFERMGVPPTLTAIILLIGVISSLIGLKKYKFRYFLLQHFLLTITSVGALLCILNGSYADGVIRDFTFLFSDQFPAIAITLLYSGTLLEYNFNKFHKK